MTVYVWVIGGAIACVGWLLAGLSSVLAQGTVCQDTQNLLDMPLNALEEATPCTELGSFYIMGLVEHPKGIDFSKHMPTVDKLNDEFPYYANVRAYLRAGFGADPVAWNPDDFIPLLVALSTLPEGFPYTDVGDSTRSNLYRAYIWKEFAWHNSTGFSKNFKYLTQILPELTGPLSSVADLSCFIENDLPIVSVEAILGSRKFKNCVEREALQKQK